MTRLQSVFPDISDLTRLQYLYINHNNIATLPKGTFSSMKNLVALYLVGNYLTVSETDF